MVKIPVQGGKSDSTDGDSPDTRPVFRVEDRRFSARGDGDAAAAEEPSRLPTYVEQLLAQTATAEKKLAEKVRWMDEEVARVRERLTREHERQLESEKRKLVASFLQVADDLDRAVAAAQDGGDASTVLEGLKLIQGSFLAALRQLNVECLDLLDEAFDPHLSEAVSLTEVDDQERDQKVLEVVEKGYRMGQQLLRPAKVRVGKLSPETQTTGG